MSTDLEYHLLDVFTDRPFAGNALAVFVDPPRDLSDGQMQSLARELNLSESVFVWSPVHHGSPWPTRIFTPGTELPFAGHPTVGTAVLLAELGHAADGVVLSEGVGEVMCTVDKGEATLTSPRLPERFLVESGDLLAESLALRAADLHPDMPPVGYSCGVPFTIVVLRDRETVARARVPVGASQTQFYVVAPVDETFTHWRARMFAPGFGIAEDPATGAAAAAFAGVLGGLDVGEATIEQGVEMGRPSTIRVAVDRGPNGALSAVRVGGRAVVVGGGRLRRPDDLGA